MKKNFVVLFVGLIFGILVCSILFPIAFRVFDENLNDESFSVNFIDEEIREYYELDASFFGVYIIEVNDITITKFSIFAYFYEEENYYYYFSSNNISAYLAYKDSINLVLDIDETTQHIEEIDLDYYCSESYFFFMFRPAVGMLAYESLDSDNIFRLYTSLTNLTIPQYSYEYFEGQGVDLTEEQIEMMYVIPIIVVVSLVELVIGSIKQEID